MWAGAMLAVFPLVAHLMTRYARSRRVFPSLLLLQSSAAHQTRMMKLRRRLLLLLRCLFVAAVVAAFARPVWHGNRHEALAAARANAVVLLIDTSASMQVTRGGVPLMDLAKAEANRILSDLRSGTDLATIVLVDAHPHAVFEELSPNLVALREELKRQTATQQRADMVTGLEIASHLLRECQGVRHLVVLSDLQAISWRPLIDARTAALLPPDTDVSIVDLKPITPGNVSINLPRHDPQQPLVGQTVALTAQLRNHDDRPRQVRVAARVDQQTLPAVQVALEPGQSKDVAFETSWDRDGFHDVTFQLDHDAFSLDDECYWVSQCHTGIPVAVVSDDDPTVVGTAGYFLSLALAPHKDPNDRFVVTTVASRGVPRAELTQYSTVFVGYLGLMEKPIGESLLGYVQQGGACVIFCGQGPVRRNLLLLDELLPGGCLPWLPSSREDLYRKRQSAHIAGGQWRARLLRDFDAASQTALSRIQFGSRWRVPQVRAEADVLLSYEGGVPALAARAIGQGQFVLANWSPDVESSDLGKHGVFVALTQLLAQNLHSTDVQAGHVHVGDPLLKRLTSQSAASEVVVIDPRGRQHESTLRLVDSSTHVQVAATAQAGIYRFRSQDRDIDAVAVNLDPTESDLRNLAIHEVRQALSSQPGQSVESNMATWHKPIDPEGKPLWGWMVLLAMLMTGGELALLGWWRR
jgi:hypothetical protein